MPIGCLVSFGFVGDGLFAYGWLSLLGGLAPMSRLDNMLPISILVGFCLNLFFGLAFEGDFLGRRLFGAGVDYRFAGLNRRLFAFVLRLRSLRFGHFGLATLRDHTAPLSWWFVLLLFHCFVLLLLVLLAHFFVG